jgi:hypothetical protein
MNCSEDLGVTIIDTLLNLKQFSFPKQRELLEKKLSTITTIDDVLSFHGIECLLSSNIISFSTMHHFQKARIHRSDKLVKSV